MKINSPFFVFETPSLSTHANSKDTGGGLSSRTAVAAAAGAEYERRSSYQSGGSTGRSRPRTGEAERRGVEDGDFPPNYPSHHRPERRQGNRSRSPSRWASDADQAAAAAAAAALEAGKMQARRAASLLYSSLRFAAAVRSETLPPGETRHRCDRAQVYSRPPPTNLPRESNASPSTTTVVLETPR